MTDYRIEQMFVADESSRLFYNEENNITLGIMQKLIYLLKRQFIFGEKCLAFGYGP